MRHAFEPAAGIEPAQLAYRASVRPTSTGKPAGTIAERGDDRGVISTTDCERFTAGVIGTSFVKDQASPKQRRD